MDSEIFQQIFDQSPQPKAIFRVDHNFVLEICNKAFGVYFKMQQDDCVGLNLHAFLDHSKIDIEQVEAELANAVFKNEILVLPYGEDPGIFNFNADLANDIKILNFTPFRQAKDGSTMLQFSISDGTAEVLKNRIKFIEKIINHSPLGIAANKITDGTRVYVNKAFGEIYGWPPDELPDVNSFFDKVFQDTAEREKMKTRIVTDMNSCDPKRLAWKGIRIDTSNGEKRVVNARNIPLPEDDIMISTVVDVTEEYRKSSEVEQLKTTLEAIINATEDHIWAIGLDKNIIAANAAFAEIMKVKMGEDVSVGAQITGENVNDKTLKRWTEYFGRAFQGEVIKFQEETWNKDTHFPDYADVTLSPMWNSNGAIMGIAAFSKNITEQVVNRIALENARDEFSKILDSSLDIICTADGNGLYVSVSKAAERLWGYAPFELEGMNFLDFVHPEFIEPTKEVSERLKAGGEIGEFENVIIKKDGSSIHMLWSARWDRTAQLMYCVARDATQRNQLKNAADQERKRYTQILENAPAFVCALSISNIENRAKSKIKFEMVNREFLHLFRKKDVVGKLVFEVFPEVENSEIISIFYQVAITGSSFRISEMEFTLNIGDKGTPVEKSFSLDISPNRNLDGIIEGVFIFGVDITEQVESRRELQVANDRFRYINKASFDAIWDWDLRTNMIDWGEGFESIFGHRLDNNQSDLDFWSDLVHPADEERVVISLSEAQKSEDGHWSEEYRFKKSDGSYAIVIDKGIVVRNPKGEPTRMIGSMQDITIIKQLEELLTRTSRMARIGAWEIYPGPGVINFSDVLAELVELPEGTSVDHDTLRWIFSVESPEMPFAERLNIAITAGLSWDEEIKIKTFSNKIIWVRSRGEVEMANGVCLAIYASIQDIDEQKNTQLKLAEAYAENENILESIGDAFFTIDNNRKVTYWNGMAEVLSGVKRETLLGKDFISAYPFELDNQYFSMYEKMLKTGEKISFESFNARQKIWLEFSAYPSSKGVSVYFRDITERKYAEEKLVQLNAKLKLQTEALTKSNRELEQFAYVASHDLQEPLRMVSGFLSQLDKKYSDKLDDKARDYIHFAVDGAMRMRNIILDLLEYSRIGSGRKSLQDVNLPELTDELLLLLSSEVAAANAIFRHEGITSIKTYKSPLTQVLQNLIGNSLKYAKKGIATEVRLSVTEDEDSWIFAVRDNGIGISSEYHERIFEMFQRLHSRDQYPGTGMGLALTRKIIENLGGEIWVESVPDQGSTFTFTLPKM